MLSRCAAQWGWTHRSISHGQGRPNLVIPKHAQPAISRLLLSFCQSEIELFDGCLSMIIKADHVMEHSQCVCLN